MKSAAFIAAFAVLSCSADQSLETFSPHFSTNMPIIWRAHTNQLPKEPWIYKRLPPRPFSAAVISNAMLLASLEKKPCPKPSTNDFYLSEDKGPNYPGPIPVYFSIRPRFATIFYGMPHPGTNTAEIPADKILIQRAWECAVRLNVDPAQVEFKEMTSRFNTDENYNELTDQLSGRGVFLSRKLDKILFWGNGEEGNNEGFWIEFASHGQISAFALVWPELQRQRQDRSAGTDEITRCIRAFKIVVLPEHGETNYFKRLKALSTAKTLTITNITAYYGDGQYGGEPKDNEPETVVEPIAVLDAIAGWEGSNAPVRLISPLTESGVKRLLSQKKAAGAGKP